MNTVLLLLVYCVNFGGKFTSIFSVNFSVKNLKVSGTGVKPNDEKNRSVSGYLSIVFFFGHLSLVYFNSLDPDPTK